MSTSVFNSFVLRARAHKAHTAYIRSITCGVCMCLCVNVCTRALFHKTQGEVARARAASPLIFQCGRWSCTNSNSGGQCITCGPRSVGTVIVLSSCHRTASYTNILTHTHAYTLKCCVFVLCCYDDDDADDDGGTCARRKDMLWRRNLSRTDAHVDFENKRNIIWTYKNDVCAFEIAKQQTHLLHNTSLYSIYIILVTHFVAVCSQTWWRQEHGVMLYVIHAHRTPVIIDPRQTKLTARDTAPKIYVYKHLCSSTKPESRVQRRETFL